MTVRHSLAAAALAAALASSAPANPPPLPIDELCALICGGLWLNDTGPMEPYFFRFEKDARYGVIRGRSGPHGGKPALPSDAMIVYGFDNNTLDFWAVESSKSHTPQIGKVELTSTGYSVSRQDQAGKITMTFGFPDPDTLLHAMVTETNGFTESTSPVLYRRIKE